MPKKYIKKKDRIKEGVTTENTDIASSMVSQNEKPKPDDPKTVAENLTNDNSAGEEKPKRQYKKREKLDELKGSFKPIVTVGLNFLSQRMPNPIEPSEPEIEMVDNALTECINLYGGTIAEYIPLVTLAGSIAMFTIPRLQKTDNSGNE